MMLVDKWFPGKPDESLPERLKAFYEQRNDYHAMTASEAKLKDPQVGLLQCLVHSDGRYLEVGCGGGVVTRQIAETACVTGVDGSGIAIEKAFASAASGERCEFKVASAYKLPCAGASMDGVYSFEVLEHLLDPVAAVREMVRVLKPCGFLLISTPNRFSLDWHLKKNGPARCADLLMAGLRAVRDAATNKPFVLFEPDLDGDVYPDCDAVSCIVPAAFCRAVESMGMETIFWDSGYMCAHRYAGCRLQDAGCRLKNGGAIRKPAYLAYGEAIAGRLRIQENELRDLKFQRRHSKGMLRRFGDHFLMMFRKRAQQ